MTDVPRLAALYGLFAVAATSANLATQAAIRAALEPGAGAASIPYWIALIAGTGTGLVVKYLLDRRWIFRAPPGGIAVHARQFSLYTLTGVATTAIFWCTQTGFHVATGSEAMLYVGGALGLAVGYATKYWLDRRHVFERGAAAA